MCIFSVCLGVHVQSIFLSRMLLCFVCHPLDCWHLGESLSLFSSSVLFMCIFRRVCVLCSSIKMVVEIKNEIREM